MKKILTIVGARPQFIKASAVSRAFQNYSNLEEIIIHTGQHFDENMSQVFFDELQIPLPHRNLEVNGKGHGEMTGEMLYKIEQFIKECPVDLVLVYGDTNSTLAGALAAVKLHIPIAHVEAGLRSFNMEMPEEVNRIITDRISNLLFAPTDTALRNLRREGFDNMDNQLFNVGDVMCDVAEFYKSALDKRQSKSNYILCTIHRAENTDKKEKLSIIVNSLNQIHRKVEVLMPLHPRTKQKLNEFNLKLNVNTIDPLSYGEMVVKLNNCSLVITDSGGLQKEAFFFEKKCVTLRDQTEWVELIDIGVNTLSSIRESEIIKKVDNMLRKSVKFDEPLYGTGNAAEKIVNEINNYFKK